MPAAPPPQDPILTDLVRAVEDVGTATVPITLWVGGALVAGTLVTYATWLNEVIFYFQTHDIAAGGDAFAPVYEELPHDRPPDRDHIHLSGARAFAPGAPMVPPNGGVPWRARIREVDAWSFGVLTDQ
jgi:hypothetical protein